MEELFITAFQKTMNGEGGPINYFIIFMGSRYLIKKFFMQPMMEIKGEIAVTNKRLGSLFEKVETLETLHQGRMNIFEVGLRDLRTDFGDLKLKIVKPQHTKGAKDGKSV